MPGGKCTTPRPGYVMLIATVVLGSIATVVVLGLGAGVTMTSGDSRTASQAIRARAAAAACAELALDQLRQNPVASVGSLDLTEATCTYTTTDTGGGTFAIAATGVSVGVTRHQSVIVTATSPAVAVSAWRDTAAP